METDLHALGVGLTVVGFPVLGRFVAGPAGIIYANEVARVLHCPATDANDRLNSLDRFERGDLADLEVRIQFLPAGPLLALRSAGKVTPFHVEQFHQCSRYDVGRRVCLLRDDACGPWQGNPMRCELRDADTYREMVVLEAAARRAYAEAQALSKAAREKSQMDAFNILSSG